MRLYVLLTSLLATALAVAVLALPRVELDEARATARAEITEDLALLAVRGASSGGAAGSGEGDLAAWAEARGVSLGLARAGQVTFISGDADEPLLVAAIEDLALRAASDGPGPEDAAAGWLRVHVSRSDGRIVAAGVIPHGEGFVVLARAVEEPAAAGLVARTRALLDAGDEAPIEVLGALAGGLVLLMLGLILAGRRRARGERRPAPTAIDPAPSAEEGEPRSLPDPTPAPMPQPAARPITARVAPPADPWRPDERDRPAAVPRAGAAEDEDDALPEVEPLPVPGPTLAGDAPTLKTPALSAQELAMRVLYDDFMALRARCGEPTSGLDYPAFCETVRRNEASLRARHGCASVRLEVLENNGRAALRMVPA